MLEAMFMTSIDTGTRTREIKNIERATKQRTTGTEATLVPIKLWAFKCEQKL